MKKIVTFFLFVLVITASSFAWDLRTGLYDLYGVSSDGRKYQGQVEISPQGENYKVTWYIGSNQTQVGIGIHRSGDSIFSVAFLDLDNAHWGTISYKVGAFGDLEGKWCESTSFIQGRETLKWVSY